jgi:hypothetical protein
MINIPMVNVVYLSNQAGPVYREDVIEHYYFFHLLLQGVSVSLSFDIVILISWKEAILVFWFFDSLYYDKIIK